MHLIHERIHRIIKGGKPNRGENQRRGKLSSAWCETHRAPASTAILAVQARLVSTLTGTPSCFPTSADDVCPTGEKRRGSKWKKSWGDYPFEVWAPPPSLCKGGRPCKRPKQVKPPGFSFAVVRNPYERLASVYHHHINALDKQGAVWRSWIRIFHKMGEKVGAHCAFAII